ncbi:hypothetical protein [Pontibacter sp. H249]|uniref:hypothetical protein n=1 Tax=Pontibacter sp. H249 TaxID=3133420 RepID=UPI0030C2E97E
MLNYIYPFLLLLLMWQCQNDSTKPQTEDVKFGETFSLVRGEQVEITGEGETLTLKLQNVIDSRCPSDANCVWLGNATATFTASNAQESDKELQMCIGDCRPAPVRSKHTLTVTVGGTGYNIILKEVLPYPSSEERGDKKEVRMVVEVL